MQHGVSMAVRDRRPADAFARLNLLGESPAFQNALRVIERVAAVDVSLLIQGETGTGKELAARALHYLSHRRNFAFVPVNCGALPENLLESELFGHERGAFTDAKRASRGLVTQADRGTLFFDEVEAMSPRAQAVLLRFLQDHQYRSVGGNLIRRADVRIVAASNADLDEMVERSLFRRDLLFRFGVLRVTMPALRDREGDAILLARHFMDRFSAQYGQPPKQLRSDLIARLQAHDWPGNVRELENLILRQLLLDEEDVAGATLARGPTGAPAAEGSDPPLAFSSAKALAVAQFEETYLRRLLTRTAGNISLAARLSRKDRSTLNKLVKKHGLKSEQFRADPR
jgi:DNA-binding NtrC family response regulator